MQSLADRASPTLQMVVRHAGNEHKKRKLIHECSAGASIDEVSASKVRKVAVEMALAF